jgi:CHAT domain-containing protein
MRASASLGLPWKRPGARRILSAVLLSVGLGTSPPSLGSERTAAQDESSIWDSKWHQLQSAPEKLALGDHWRLCELKFRFRHYRDLFTCLDLIEARISKLDIKAAQRRYAPVLVGWMRALAYAELGDNLLALHWANSAWQQLPPPYRDGSAGVGGCPFCGKDEFQAVTIEAGGSHWNERASDQRYAGLNNPAGLDLRSQTVAMSLAAERALLHVQRGETEAGQEALKELLKWHHGLFPVFGGKAHELSLGIMFAMGDYSGVVRQYGLLQFGKRLEGLGRDVNNVLWLGLPSILARVGSVADSRMFADALEDASNRVLYATALAREGQTERARNVFDRVLAEPEFHAMGSLYWAALYERSRIAERDGDRAQAIQLLKQAVDEIERVRDSITFEAGKIGFASSKQDVYAALVNYLAESDDWKGAFTVAERAKGRALVDLLAQVRELPPPAGADDRVRQLFAQAASYESDSVFADSAETLGSRGIVVTARAELAQVAPDAVSLLSVQSASPEQISDKLGPEEALVDYFQAGTNLYAFVLLAGKVSGFKLHGETLAEDTRRFRAAIESRNRGTKEQARRLYDTLLRPLLSALPATQLTLSPHGVLHYLPFAALMDGDQYVVDRFSLRITPSASALVYLKTDKPEKPGRLLALGNPDLGDSRYDLPQAQAEALGVAQMFPNSRALLGRDATKDAVRKLGSAFSILHFASHGTFDSDAPLNSGLSLAGPSEAVGRLTVTDLYALRLDAQLVTLSACDTGLGKILNGDDVIGLTRGFLHAGARSVMASLWSVDDSATAQLMISFYRELDSHGMREALRLAQINTRAAHPEPLYWAAFEVMGSAN